MNTWNYPCSKRKSVWVSEICCAIERTNGCWWRWRIKWQWSRRYCATRKKGVKLHWIMDEKHIFHSFVSHWIVYICISWLSLTARPHWYNVTNTNRMKTKIKERFDQTIWICGDLSENLKKLNDKPQRMRQHEENQRCQCFVHNSNLIRNEKKWPISMDFKFEKHFILRAHSLHKLWEGIKFATLITK